ncbi:MAG: hypothetical protein ABIA93_00580 [Candidatus Woesearchaeota archaeon]
MGIRTLIGTLALMGIAAYGGCAVGRNESPNNMAYKVELLEDQAYLRAVSLDRTYPLYCVNGDVFMGGFDHHLQGVKALAFADTSSTPESTLEKTVGMLGTMVRDLRRNVSSR